MRFADHRPTLIKGLDEADPHSPVTPRWLSPMPGKSGYEIAKQRDELLDIPFPVTRRRIRKPRMRLPGVALRVKPWHTSE